MVWRPGSWAGQRFVRVLCRHHAIGAVTTSVSAEDSEQQLQGAGCAVCVQLVEGRGPDGPHCRAASFARAAACRGPLVCWFQLETMETRPRAPQSGGGRCLAPCIVCANTGGLGRVRERQNGSVCAAQLCHAGAALTAHSRSRHSRAALAVCTGAPMYFPSSQKRNLTGTLGCSYHKGRRHGQAAVLLLKA